MNHIKKVIVTSLALLIAYSSNSHAAAGLKALESAIDQLGVLTRIGTALDTGKKCQLVFTNGDWRSFTEPMGTYTLKSGQREFIFHFRRSTTGSDTAIRFRYDTTPSPEDGDKGAATLRNNDIGPGLTVGMYGIGELVCHFEYSDVVPIKMAKRYNCEGVIVDLEKEKVGTFQAAIADKGAGSVTFMRRGWGKQLYPEYRFEAFWPALYTQVNTLPREPVQWASRRECKAIR